MLLVYFYVSVISIHVPAWGTTTVVHLYPGTSQFQSTFPRGERRQAPEDDGGHRYFNPRSRVGNDHRQILFSKRQQDFNPRSRVGNDRAATLISVGFNLFQSTFPRGERQNTTHNQEKAAKFQSTFPRGERQDQLSAAHGDFLNFNPRSRVGNDTLQLTIRKRQLNFNPRSRVGNDCITCAISRRHLNFNPRSRVGNDCPEFPVRLFRLISIHVPAWGTTQHL